MAMVSSAHPIASHAGIEILKNGGTAFDAAVAVSFVLTVVESNQSSALTGDGFGLFYLPGANDVRIADWSSRTPLAPEFRERVDEIRNPLGPLSLQAPTGLAGVLSVHEELATMSRQELLAPAIAYAAEGFPVDERLRTAIDRRVDIFSNHPQTARNFLVDGKAPRVGHVLRFPELADTLRRIAEGGKDVLYAGELAGKILHFVEEFGGILTRADLELASRAPVWSEPLSTSYRGYVIKATPPVGGGIPFLEAMNILEGFDLTKMSLVERLHTLAETLKLVLIDMDEYVGDPGSRDVPVDLLISKELADERRRLIMPDGVLPWGRHPVKIPGDGNTSHFSVVDDDGNIASITQTRSDWGIKVPVDDTGMFLHNGIRLLSTDPTHPMYAGVPGKRFQKSMTPVLVQDQAGRPVLTLGAAGIRRITSGVTQVTVNHLDLGLCPQSAINEPRVSYASRGRGLTVSSSLPNEVIRGLMNLGHSVAFGSFARVQAISMDPETGVLMGGADVGGAAYGYPVARR